MSDDSTDANGRASDFTTDEEMRAERVPAHGTWSNVITPKERAKIDAAVGLTPDDFRALHAQQQGRRDAPDGVPLNLSGSEERAGPGRISYACPAVGYDAVMRAEMPFYFCPDCGIPCGVATMRRHVVPEHDRGVPIEVPEAERYKMKRHHANTPLLQAAHAMCLSRDWVIDLLLRALMDQTAATEKALTSSAGPARIVLTGIEKPS